MNKIQTLDEMFAENTDGFVNPVRPQHEEDMLHKMYLERKAQETDQRLEVPRPEYEAGWQAFGNGEPFMSNPYLKDSAEYIKWQCGWIEAEEDAEE